MLPLTYALAYYRKSNVASVPGNNFTVSIFLSANIRIVNCFFGTTKKLKIIISPLD